MTEDNKPMLRTDWAHAAMLMCETMPGGDHMKAALMGRGGEEAVRQMALWSWAIMGPLGTLRGTPCQFGDKLVREQRLGACYVDLAAWHANGSVTLIEIKDGGAGRSAVLAGIGQVCAYESIARSMGWRVACRALLWSPCDGVDDDLVTDACRLAGVVPLIGIGHRGAIDVVTEFARRRVEAIAMEGVL